MITTRLVLAALLVVGVLAGCSKDDEHPATSGDPTTTAGESPGTVVGAPATAVVVTATDFAYGAETLAEPIAAGEVTITLENEGDEEHQASIIRFREGRSPADLATVGEDPSQLSTIMDGFGGPNAVVPGSGSTTTQHLEAGEYFLACFIPSPGDGVPHVAKGMLAPFTVEGDAGEPEETADQVIALDEYDFGFGDDALIPAGSYVFRNDGEQVHEAVVYGPAEGASAEDLVEYFTSGERPSGPPPVGVGAGIAGTNPGTAVRTDLDLEAGDYVFICFVPDAEDGAPHFTKGMVQVVSVE